MNQVLQNSDVADQRAIRQNVNRTNTAGQGLHFPGEGATFGQEGHP